PPHPTLFRPKRTERSPGLGDNWHQRGHIVKFELWFAGNVYGPLGYQHVRPEVTKGPNPPDIRGQLEKFADVAAVAPAFERGKRERRIMKLSDIGGMNTTGIRQGLTGVGATGRTSRPATG